MFKGSIFQPMGALRRVGPWWGECWRDHLRGEQTRPWEETRVCVSGWGGAQVPSCVCVCVCLGGVGHRSLPVCVCLSVWVGWGTGPFLLIPLHFLHFPGKPGQQRDSQNAVSTEAQAEVHRWFVRSPRSGTAVGRAPPCLASSKATSISLDAGGAGTKEETAPLIDDFFRHVGSSSLLSGSRAVGPQGVSSLKSNSSRTLEAESDHSSFSTNHYFPCPCGFSPSGSYSDHPQGLLFLHQEVNVLR